RTGGVGWERGIKRREEDMAGRTGREGGLCARGRERFEWSAGSGASGAGEIWAGGRSAARGRRIERRTDLEQECGRFPEGGAIQGLERRGPGRSDERGGIGIFCDVLLDGGIVGERWPKRLRLCQRVAG